MKLAKRLFASPVLFLRAHPLKSLTIAGIDVGFIFCLLGLAQFITFLAPSLTSLPTTANSSALGYVILVSFLYAVLIVGLYSLAKWNIVMLTKDKEYSWDFPKFIFFVLLNGIQLIIFILGFLLLALIISALKEPYNLLIFVVLTLLYFFGSIIFVTVTQTVYGIHSKLGKALKSGLPLTLRFSKNIIVAFLTLLLSATLALFAIDRLNTVIIYFSSQVLGNAPQWVFSIAVVLIYLLLYCVLFYLRLYLIALTLHSQETVNPPKQRKKKK